jgi:hypothetical protein
MDHKKFTGKNDEGEFNFRRLRGHLMEPSDYDEDTVLCQRYGTTGGVDRRERTINQKTVAVHGSPCTPIPRVLILIQVANQ